MQVFYRVPVESIICQSLKFLCFYIVFLNYFSEHYPDTGGTSGKNRSVKDLKGRLLMGRSVESKNCVPLLNVNDIIVSVMHIYDSYPGRSSNSDGAIVSCKYRWTTVTTEVSVGTPYSATETKTWSVVSTRPTQLANLFRIFHFLLSLLLFCKLKLFIYYLFICPFVFLF